MHSISNFGNIGNILLVLDGVFLFRAFLKSEFSHENLDFWLAVQDFKESKPQEMVNKANTIYNNYIASKAPNQVKYYLKSTTVLNTIFNKLII